MLRTLMKFVLMSVSLLLAHCSKAKQPEISPSKKESSSGKVPAGSIEDENPFKKNSAPPIDNSIEGPLESPQTALNSDITVIVNGAKKPWDGGSLLGNRLWKIEDVE